MSGPSLKAMLASAERIDARLAGDREAAKAAAEAALRGRTEKPRRRKREQEAE